MKGKTNVKKWKTFERSTETYQSGTKQVPVYGTRPTYGTRQVPVYTNVTGICSITDTGCVNRLNVPITFYGVWASYATQYNGSGSKQIGTVTVPAGGSWGHDFVSYASGGYSSCNWGFDYAMVGNKRYNRTSPISNVGTVQTGTTTETYQTGTEQYIDHYDTVPVYSTREIVTETWHPWWVKKSA